MPTHRPSFRDSFRSLNRAPFAVGLVAVIAGLMGIVGLLGGWSWGLALLSLWSLAFGLVLILAYYRLRDDERANS